MPGVDWPGPIVLEALAALEDAVHALVRPLDPPAFLADGPPRFRFASPTSQHIQILKAVRVVSGLHAAVVLVKQGFTQEAGVLFRTINEFIEEIWFLDEAHYSTPNQAQLDFMRQFFSRDTRTTEEMREATPKAARVLARKKRASAGRTLGQFDTPEKIMRRSEAIDDVMSSYVHGEYPCIMELFEGSLDGTPGRFRMRGMLDTPTVPVFTHWVSLLTHAALTTVAKMLHDARDLERKAALVDIRNRFSRSDEYSTEPGGNS